MNDSRRAAWVLFQVICRCTVTEHMAIVVRDYFADQGVPVTLPVFREWLTRVQRDLDNQPALAALAEQWRQKLGNRRRFTATEAEQFHRQYASALDTGGIMTQPVVTGYVRRDASGTFDLEISQPRRSTAWILLYTVAGTAELRAGLREFSITAGNMLLMSPNAVYTMRRHRSARQWSHYWISFQPHTDWRPHLDWPTAAPHIGSLHIPGAQREKIGALIDDLIESSTRQSPIKLELEANLLQQLLLRCHELFADTHDPRTDDRIEKAQQYIEAHYSEPFRLDHVAAATHMSPSRLSALFKQHTGISVLAWRDERRLIQAARLLRSTSESIAEIGSQVGFSDAAYFSRTFRKHIGYSPRQYRQRQQLNLIDTGD